MRKTIPATQLRLGMHVHKLLGPWMNHPFWRTSFVVEDQATVDTIVASGIAEVVIDVGRGVDVAPLAVAVTPSEEDAIPLPDISLAAIELSELDRAGPEPVERASFEAEIVRARKICLDSKEVITAMLKEARLGRAINADAALPVVEEIASSVLRNPTALISVARLKSADDYTYLHSVAVCALMVALGRQLGLNETSIREAGLGGLLHDMGKAAMPLDVLNKPGKLTDDEYALIKTHPEHGHRMLCEGGVTDVGVLDIAIHHHERIDGAGYPHKLAADDISMLARMGAVCDVYDAITSNRPYKPGWDPAESIRRMTSWKGHFDTKVLKAFIKSVGIYPLGALVRLESDKLGVVVEQNSVSFLKPTVQVFFSAKTRAQILIHRVDLAATDCQDRIVGVESPSQWGFKNLERLWMP